MIKLIYNEEGSNVVGLFDLIIDIIAYVYDLFGIYEIFDGDEQYFMEIIR